MLNAQLMENDEIKLSYDQSKPWIEQQNNEYDCKYEENGHSVRERQRAPLPTVVDTSKTMG